MKLLARFNLIFISVFGVGLAVALWFANSFLQNDAQTRVLEQAKLMMEMTLSTRHYTTKNIQPLLSIRNFKGPSFVPETVPAFAATTVFKDLHSRYPEYVYKEATLNPTNRDDRAVDWETDVVTFFRNHPDQKEFSNERDSPTGKSLFLARPLIVRDSECLVCHSTPDQAPKTLIHDYPAGGGFGWKLNEIIGAQIVSVPEDVPMRMASQALKTLLLYLVITGLITLLMLDVVLVVTVIRPVAKLSQMADEISHGNMDVPELPVKGRDEISVLATSFNRMQRSLIRAMKMLESDET
jgi:protein-histidine pros-kinase